MILNPSEYAEFNSIARLFKHEDKVQEMKNYIQHGNVTTYQHCKDVAKYSFWLSKRFHLNVNTELLVKGAFLHDFFLYDWHKKSPRSIHHGWRHAQTASINAKKYLKVDDEVCLIIETHMWPFGIRNIPRSKEAWLVAIADKICATRETIFCRWPTSLNY